LGSPNPECSQEQLPGSLRIMRPLPPAASKRPLTALLLPAERAANDILRLLHNRGEVIGALETLGIELINILRPGWAGGKPAVDRDDL
jgi:hypothetical protein